MSESTGDAEDSVRQSALPFLTADLPGTGGSLKQRPEDFVVEEVPAYEPSGAGEHLFLWIEKHDVAAEALLRRVAAALNISTREIGVAGLKDRRAITRQFLSVPARCAADVAKIETDRIRVFRSSLHDNKLRTGHLRGNRFSIRIADVVPDGFARAQRITERIAAVGSPNYFGDQRFGREDETLRTGLGLIRGTVRPHSIPPSRRRFLLRLALSSVQSALFNAVLAQRLGEGLLHTVLAGDVLQKTDTGGIFVAADVPREQERFDRRETVLTGPIFGPEMLAPTGEPADREERVLSDWGLGRADFERFAKLTRGTRRPLIICPEELAVDADTDGLRIRFRLPSGAYATTVLAEFMKPVNA